MYFDGEERMVAEDEERATIGAAEEYVDGALGHIDFPDLLAASVVDKNLSVGHIDVAACIDRDALAAALGKYCKFTEGAVCAHDGAVGTVFRCAADMYSLTGSGAYEAIGIETV